MGFRLKSSLLSLIAFILSVSTLIVVLAPFTIADPGRVPGLLKDHRFARSILLSIATAGIAASIALAVATPIAYHVSRRRGIASNILSSLYLLFLGLPPVGLGISLLIALREYPLISEISSRLGLVFTIKSIVIAQATIVSPLSVSMLVNVFNYIPRTIDELSSMYGAGELYKFRRIILPLALPGMLATWILAFFRALGEFGATLVLAGNTPGYTETLPLAMYNMMAIADVEAAAILLSITIAIGALAIIIHSYLQAVLVRRLQEAVI